VGAEVHDRRILATPLPLYRLGFFLRRHHNDDRIPVC
jgi:hypothetical protein